MSAHDVLQNLVVSFLMQGVGFLFLRWYFYWRKQTESPEKAFLELKESFERWREETAEEFKQLNEKLTKVRASNARIRGILNGHGWKTSIEED